MSKIKYRIIADENMGEVAAIFSCLGDVVLMPGREMCSDALKHCDILLVRSVTRVNAALLKNTPVKVVGSATAGLEHIDLKYLQDSNIYFTNAKGANANAVAEYVLSGLASLSLLEKENFFSKKIAVVGYGAVGRALVAKLKVLHANVVVCDPLIDKQEVAEDGFRFCEWDAVVDCDAISFHVPFTRKGVDSHPTEGMIGADFLSRIKGDAVLINAARGEICDEAALVSAKKQNPMLKLVWDTWKNEPKISMELLQQVSLGTMHIAGYSMDAKLAANHMLLEKIASYLCFDLTENKARVDSSVLIDIAEGSKHDDVNSAFSKDKYFPIIKTFLACYNPIEDMQSLLRMQFLPEENRFFYFDKLRKQYRQRPEWGRVLLNGNCYDAKQKALLQQLGFAFGASCAN